MPRLVQQKLREASMGSIGVSTAPDDAAVRNNDTPGGGAPANATVPGPGGECVRFRRPRELV